MTSAPHRTADEALLQFRHLCLKFGQRRVLEALGLMGEHHAQRLKRATDDNGNAGDDGEGVHARGKSRSLSNSASRCFVKDFSAAARPTTKETLDSMTFGFLTSPVTTPVTTSKRPSATRRMKVTSTSTDSAGFILKSFAMGPTYSQQGCACKTFARTVS